MRNHKRKKNKEAEKQGKAKKTRSKEAEKRRKAGKCREPQKRGQA